MHNIAKYINYIGIPGKNKDRSEYIVFMHNIAKYINYIGIPAQ